MYRWVSHTGEAELELEASRESDVFVDALHALAEVLGEPDGQPERRTVELEARDLETLLADWLSELVYLAEAERFLGREAEVGLADGRLLRAVVEGSLGRPSFLVKGVTYHGLSFGPADGGWRARVVLDV
ncbi:MAG: archease [Thermoleophilia bacterium]|nr:archease [Thermoleophilia bacterium]